MTLIRTLLVDDEPISTKHLKNLLSTHAPEIEVISTAKNVDDALEKIYLLKPDLVFLDIELGGESGFDLLTKCGTRKFELIFVTAHNQYGIDAVKAKALDYILKPINKVELLMAVENVIQKINKAISIPSPQTSLTRISLSTIEGLTFVEVNDIIYVESDGRYSRFHLVKDKKMLVTKNLGKFETELASSGFIRIHNSYLVNLSFVEKYVKGRGGNVVLKNGKSLEVSSRKKDDFFDKL